MEVKKKVPSNTITRDIKYLAEPTGNIYETVVLLYKRANQIALAEKKELAKKLDVQVSQQELIDYMIQMSQQFGMDINQLFQDSSQVSSMVAQLGRTKALIETLRSVSVKDTEGADVDLSAFFGDAAADEDAAAEDTEADDEGAEVVTEEEIVEVVADEDDSEDK